MVLAVHAAGFTWGMLRQIGVHFCIGDEYPEYSSLRSDPLGSRLLFESLGRLPGLTVTRNYLPLEFFSGKPSTILLLGVNPSQLHAAEFVQLIKRVSGRGHRVVIALAERSATQGVDRPFAKD